VVPPRERKQHGEEKAKIPGCRHFPRRGKNKAKAFGGARVIRKKCHKGEKPVFLETLTRKERKQRLRTLAVSYPGKYTWGHYAHDLTRRVEELIQGEEKRNVLHGTWGDPLQSRILSIKNS